MYPEIKIFSDIKPMTGYLAGLLESALGSAKGYPVSIALSGGSTPRKIFEKLASDYFGRMDWGRIQFFWGDERCVPPKSEESNYRMAMESLLGNIAVPSDLIYRIKGEEDPVEEARRYSGLVKEKVRLKDDIPVFDLVLLGLGEDGHTASIFPNNLELFISNKLFDVAENPYSGQLRITATGKVINNARLAVFLVTGIGKASIVSKIIERKAGWEGLPAALVRPEKGDLLWLLDVGAASGLEKYSVS